MAAAADFMARHGARLVDNGYPVIPIWPGTKKPGRFHRGEWRDYPAWTRHCDRPTTEHEAEVWARWPDAAIGFACGAVVGIDIDVLDPEAAHAAEQLAHRMLGDTPLVRIGKAPKRMLVYRAETPFAAFRRAPLEVLGHGRQFVAFAVHPDTGQPYQWTEDSPLSVDLSMLPAITEDQARAWLEAALALLPQDGVPNVIPAAAGPHQAAHSLAGTRAAIWNALAFIPNAELDYDSWVRIGMALKGALQEVGADLFLAWSAQAGKNVPDTTAKAWASFKPTAIGAGTIYHLAMERGWKPDPVLVLDGTLPQGDMHPAAGLLATLTAAPAETTPPPPLLDLPIPGGILGDMVGYMLATARRPQPELSLGASLCALGSLMGRKYRTETNLRSNLYIVAIADSGSGKNHSREVINELFVDAGLGHHLGGNKVASGAGLLTALHRQPALLLQIDEFGMFLQAAADRRRSPRHLTEILDNMTALFSAAGSIFLGAEYANRDGNNERRDINQPCLCVYGTSAPLHFWNALQSANVVDGSLARFIIVHCAEDYPDENEEAGIRTSPPALLEALRLVASGGGRASAGNLSGMTSDPTIGVDPMTVPMDAQAKDVFRTLSRETTARLRCVRGSAISPIIARIVEHAAKVALVLAVSSNPAAPVIRGEDAEWAIAFINFCTERTISEVEHRVADNDIERNHKRVMEIIRAAGPAGITKSGLIRRSQFLDKRARDEVIAALVEAGLIATANRSGTTKPITVLVAAEESDQ